MKDSSEIYSDLGPAFVDRSELEREMRGNPMHYGRWRKVEPLSRAQIYSLIGVARHELDQAVKATSDDGQISFCGRSELLADVQQWEDIVVKLNRAANLEYRGQTATTVKTVKINEPKRSFWSFLFKDT